MLFSSITFILYFLPIAIIGYYITPKKYRNITLLIYSLIFYFYGEHQFVLLFACILNYLFGLLIEKRNKKIYLILGIILNIAILGYYKYSNFFISNINEIFGLNYKLLKIVLPLGISFFTFQNISYLADVFRKEIKAQKSIIKYATYITFFPQLIAGPIVRYKDIENQIDFREESFDNLSYGIKRFIIGLGKKVLIANNVGSLCLLLQNNIVESSVLQYILLTIAFTLQIYFDFSGYSDMAIGLGGMFGFKIPENFNYPLIASSITDFWRRWHISLSSFFKDYVYIPLGGNRKGFIRQIINILIVWLLTGFWHGANWNFILWGLYFFVFLILEKFILNKFLKGKIISHIYTLIVIMFSFVIFNIEKVNEIILYFKNMFGFNSLPFLNAEILYYFKNNIMLIILGCILSTPIMKIINDKIKKTKYKKIGEVISILIIVLVFILSLAALVSSTYNPFIYFRF